MHDTSHPYRRIKLKTSSRVVLVYAVAGRFTSGSSGLVASAERFVAEQVRASDDEPDPPGAPLRLTRRGGGAGVRLRGAFALLPAPPGALGRARAGAEPPAPLPISSSKSNASGGLGWGVAAAPGVEATAAWGLGVAEAGGLGSGVTVAGAAAPAARCCAWPSPAPRTPGSWLGAGPLAAA